VSRRTEVLVLSAILLAGAALRVAFVVVHNDVDLAFDQRFYYRQATALAEQGQIPDDYVVRPPVYVAFLASVIRLCGADVTTLRMVQGVLSLFVLAAFYVLARSLLHPRLALAALAWLAVFPASIIDPWLLLTEYLFTPLLLLALWATLRAVGETSRWPWTVAAGGTWALAALTRSAAAGYFALVLIVLFLVRRVRVPRRRVLLAGAVFLLLVCPWTLRNYQRYGGFLFIDNTASYNLWLTNTPGIGIQEFTQDYWGSIKNPIEQQRRGMQEGWKAIRSNPAYYVERCAGRFAKFWATGDLYPSLQAEENRGRGTAYARVLGRAARGMDWTLLIPAALGTAWSLRRRKFLLLSGVIAYLTLTHSLVVANARHRAPLTPLLVILAVLGIAETVRSVRRYRSGDTGSRAPSISPGTEGTAGDLS
jgi:4-amino-4-deoxy-L-arabinose transferase-like glycosyltransferase